VDYNDFKDDLLHWDTLLVSTIMQKPYEVLIEDNSVNVLQKKNIVSAVIEYFYLDMFKFVCEFKRKN